MRRPTKNSRAQCPGKARRYWVGIIGNTNSLASKSLRSKKRRRFCANRKLAGACWLFRPIDPDGAIRQLCLRYQDIPSFTMAAASHAGVAFPEISGASPIRWLNYYGPAGEAFEGVSIADALREDGVPPGFFRDRTVFVGGRYSTGSLRTAKDEFGNPYSRWGRRFSPGVEVHATAFLNLLRSEWLQRPAEALSSRSFWPSDYSLAQAYVFSGLIGHWR